MKPSTVSSNTPVQKECSLSGRTAWVIWKNLFEIDEKYVPIKAIGKGAYGVVCSAENTANKEKVAIKKITNAFSHVMDARRTLREVKLLRHLKHVNVMAIRDIMLPVSLSNFSDLYVVSELMDTDLHQIIRSAQPLSDDHFQYFLYQVRTALPIFAPPQRPCSCVQAVLTSLNIEAFREAPSDDLVVPVLAHICCSADALRVEVRS